MSTNPNALDVLDSQLSSSDNEQYAEQLAKVNLERSSYWKFEIVPNKFKQSLKETDETKFNYLNENFGVIGSWDDVVNDLDHLNKSSSSNETYKILFLARHGQGYHNLAHSQYGDKAWNEYWSKLDGDGTIVWGPDPDLTSLGVSQAKDNKYVWQKQIDLATRTITPSRFFVSPLSRSIDTLIHTWSGILPIGEMKPLIMENIRETMGVHTCDKRSTKTIISDKYVNQGFVIEPEFEEEDIYWQVDYRESVAEHGLRINQALQDIFGKTTDDSIIGITSHSGSIRAQLLVLGHRSFAVGTGGMIPVFVKGTKIQNQKL
jgi:broad specificity phosphatase PhoE